MSDLDEGRDLRAAFGTLLADEPASPWSASDDVARGRALQRRRRTRAGAGIGLVAAVVMVFGVFGPLRPQPTVVVPPAYQPPAVQGVDTAWLAALDRSFTAFNGPVVDWSRSTVAPTAGGGFSLDLTLVGATVTTGGEDFTIEYAEPPGPAVARAFVTWKPGGGEGPVLASCAAPACVRADRGMSPGFAEAGGRWDADAAQLAGTFVVDRTYDDGAVLELASAPQPDTEGGWSPVMSYGGISFVLDRVGRPSDGAPADDVYGMTALLATLGWTVDGVTTQRVPEGQPTLVTWAARRTGTTTDEAPSILSVRTWDTSSWSAGEDGINPGSVISRCAGTGTCQNAAVTATTCDAQDVCWSESSALLTKPIDDVEAGSWVLYRSNNAAKLAVEIVVGRDNCPDVCAGDPYTAFLSEAETAQAAELVQATLLATPTPTPTPTPTDSDARGAAARELRVPRHQHVAGALAGRRSLDRLPARPRPHGRQPAHRLPVARVVPGVGSADRRDVDRGRGGQHRRVHEHHLRAPAAHQCALPQQRVLPVLDHHDDGRLRGLRARNALHVPQRRC